MIHFNQYTIANIEDFKQALAQMFIHYLMRFGDPKSNEVQKYHALPSVNEIADIYVGNGKRGNKFGNRNGHISRWLPPEVPLQIKPLFRNISFCELRQDKVREWQEIGKIKGIKSIVLNDLSYLTCLYLQVPMPRLYVQSDSYDSAILIRDCYRKLHSSYFIVKKDKDLGHDEHYIPQEFITELIGRVPTFYFEDWLCRYYYPIKYLYFCVMQRQSPSSDILNPLLEKTS